MLPLTRRQMLSRMGTGLGILGLIGLLQSWPELLGKEPPLNLELMLPVKLKTGSLLTKCLKHAQEHSILLRILRLRQMRLGQKYSEKRKLMPVLYIVPPLLGPPPDRPT